MIVSKKHEKHAKLTLRKTDNYASTEIAILGAKCNIIADLSQKIAKKLQKSTKIAYLDASHNSEETTPTIDKFTFNETGRLNSISETHLNKITNKIRFSSYDLLLINGNHYQGEQQIIILDIEKEDSIIKRINQLTDIKFFIKKTKNAFIFNCLKDKFSEIEQLPIYELDDINAITAHISQIIKNKIPQLNGLVLAGGKSSRMGSDKGLLNYNGQPQREYLYALLQQNLGEQSQVFLSVRANQPVENTPIITDKFLELGPFGAICSAFMHNPNKAYLVVATDLPFINKEVLELLIKKRNPKKIATAFKGKNKPFVEPLITIWEPKAYPILLSFLSQGYSCPRKVLINSEVEIIEIDDALIQNINTPQDFQKAKKQLS